MSPFSLGSLPLARHETRENIGLCYKTAKQHKKFTAAVLVPAPCVITNSDNAEKLTTRAARSTALNSVAEALMTSKTSDDDVQYYIGERLTLERETENSVVEGKKRGSMMY